MIKKFALYLFTFQLISTTYSQEALFWEIVDPVVNGDFIESYINRLIEVDKFEENSIQASFSIIVHVDVNGEKVELNKLKAKDYQMGQYISFDMSEVKKMSKDKLKMVVSREYKWKDVNRRDLSELEQFSTVDNVFKERSFKDARDAFWWSNSQISASTAMRFFIRQKSGSLAFRLEQGFPELGLSRQLSKNLLLGISNDIVSSYLIVPGNTMSPSQGIGHPLEGNIGFGFKFDTHQLGGQVNYMDVDGQEYSAGDMFSRKHLVLPSSSGLLYWSNTFQINRKVDSNYGVKIKDQQKEKARAEKKLKKGRTWNIDGKSYSGLYLGLNENNVVTIQVVRDDGAHKKAKKGKEWKTVSGSTVEASLVKQDKKNITLNRSKDDFTMVLKIKDLSDSDKDFLEKLKWDGEKVLESSLDSFSAEDQNLIRIASGTVRARSGRGRELKVSKPYGSMRLKAGLSFAQFLHGAVDLEDQITITDRVTGTDAIGVYAKVEGVTDDKKSKGYFQINVSGSGFKALLFGLEHNVYRMVTIGADFSLFPNSSYIEFQDDRDNPSSSWEWYPGTRPNESGQGGGSLLISPYLSLNF